METLNSDFKLSESEVQRLFEFAAKKLVHWYDLQIEIVDHLASAIETEMQLAPGLSFESGLDNVYKSFGIFGFAKIVQERQSQLAKAAKNRWWAALQSAFHWPQILLFLLIVSAVATVSVSVNSHVLTEVFLVTYLTIALLFFIYIIKDQRLHKRLLLMQCGATYYSLPFVFEMIILPSYVQLSPVSFTMLLTLGIMIKLTSFQLYRTVRLEAKSLYPSIFSK